MTRHLWESQMNFRLRYRVIKLHEKYISKYKSQNRAIKLKQKHMNCLPIIILQIFDIECHLSKRKSLMNYKRNICRLNRKDPILFSYKHIVCHFIINIEMKSNDWNDKQSNPKEKDIFNHFWNLEEVPLFDFFAVPGEEHLAVF